MKGVASVVHTMLVAVVYTGTHGGGVVSDDAIGDANGSAGGGGTTSTLSSSERAAQVNAVVGLVNNCAALPAMSEGELLQLLTSHHPSPITRPTSQHLPLSPLPTISLATANSHCHSSLLKPRLFPQQNGNEND